MYKNVASQKLIVFAFDSTTNLPKTGDAANITAYVSKDYGTVTVLGDTSATEMSSSNAAGYYLFDLTQAETNGDTLLFSAKSSTSNIVVVAVPATVFTYPTTGFLAPATSGRTLVVDASGLADANMVKMGPTGSGTAQTARDIGASVLLSSGTGTGQLSFASGVVQADVAKINAVSTSSVTTVNAVVGTAQPINFTGTAGSALVQTDMTKIKTQTVTCAAGVTVNANLGTTQPVNFTGTSGSAYVQVDLIDIQGDNDAASGLATAGNDYLTIGSFASNVVSFNSGTITASSIASGAFVAAVWDGLTSGHTTSGTFGGSLNSASSAGDPWATAIPGAYASGTAGHRVGTALPDIAAGAQDGLLRAGSNVAFGVSGAVDWSNGSNHIVGVTLASTGLDQISATSPTALATTWVTKMLQVWEYCFGKRVKDDTGGTIKLMQGTGTTPQVTQTFTSVTGTDTVNRGT